MTLGELKELLSAIELADDYEVVHAANDGLDDFETVDVRTNHLHRQIELS